MNSYGLTPTTPSRWRVYRFHHLGMAGVAGFEPTTNGFGDRCSTGLSYTPIEAGRTSYASPRFRMESAAYCSTTALSPQGHVLVGPTRAHSDGTMLAQDASRHDIGCAVSVRTRSVQDLNKSSHSKDGCGREHGGSLQPVHVPGPCCHLPG